MKITKIWFSDNKMYALTDDGRTLWQSLLYYRRLLTATEKERNEYEINAFGIRWEKLDEDVSFESFEYDEPEPNGISKLLLSHPELNMSAIARIIGIQQSLLAAYANGTKQPSAERTAQIKGLACNSKKLAAIVFFSPTTHKKTLSLLGGF